MRALVLVLVVSVGGGLGGCVSGDDPASLGDPVDDAELPPRGEADLAPWIDAGFYLDWACEPAPVDVRLGSPHRPATRTCSNAAMLGGGTGEYPVGAAAVKELYGAGGAIIGYAVSRKLEVGQGAAGWYWYERFAGRSPNADGVGQGSCPACHAAAVRDYVYVVAPPR